MKTLAALLLALGTLWADDKIEALGKRFSVPVATDWKATPETLELVVKHEPGTPRRPKQFALLEEGPFTEFTLEVDVKRNGKSLLLVFAHQDDGHFNYAHISLDDPAKQNVHNGVFHVFGGERVRISPLEGGPGLLPSSDWTPVKLVWNGKTGEVVCYANGKTSAALRAVDLSLKHGRMGLGSFNETGSFRNLRVTGTRYVPR
jgi:hypothetical protein